MSFFGLAQHPEWRRVLSKMTPAQVLEAFTRYEVEGEVFVWEREDGTIEFVDPERVHGFDPRQ